MSDEGLCVQYGQIVNLIIPRPSPPGQAPPSGLGKVIIEYTTPDAGAKARAWSQVQRKRVLERVRKT